MRTIPLPRFKRQRGVALIITMLALMLLSAIVIAMLYNSDSETTINANFRSYQKAYFGAVAGIEEGRMRLASSSTSVIVPPSAMPTTSNHGVFYILNPATVNGTAETVDPADTSNPYFDTELCHEGFSGLGLTDPGIYVACSAAPSGTNWHTYVTSISPFTSSASALPYKWVRITLKTNASSAPFYVDGGADSSTFSRQVCWTGFNEIVLPTGYTRCDVPPGGSPAYTPIYNLTAYAKGSHRIVQKEVAQISLPPLPAALTLAGPNPSYDAPSSNNFTVDGSDHATCGNPAPAKPAVGAYDNPTSPTSPTSVSSIVSAIPGNRADHYTGASASPDVENVFSQLGSTYGNPAGLEQLLGTIRAEASQVLLGPVSNPNLGSDSHPAVSFVDGDLTITGNFSGAGVLVVTGTFNSSGNTSFKGVVLVVGKGVWNSNGGGNGVFSGAVLVARTRDDHGNILSTLGQPSASWSGGAGNGINYDSCWLSKATRGSNFHVISARELPY